jgi:hypothetical protein
MSFLKNYFENNTGNVIDKWHHYFEVYENWFHPYRNKPVVILEIGVYQGGSLKMWKEYFGEKARIYAIDINPNCKQFEEENVHIFIGSQEDRAFLDRIKKEIPKVDILIDDGGHSMNQQIVSFEELYPHIKENGIYLCEDLHTSYWRKYGGGYNKKSSFIEYSKKLVDYLNAWHSRDEKLPVNQFTKTTASLHYYPSMLIIQKRPMQMPTSGRRGEMVIGQQEFPMPTISRNLSEKISNETAFQIQRAKKISRKILKKLRLKK